MLAERGLAWMPTLSNDVQAVLATDKVRFQGQEVAFVVAEDRYAARDALELIDVEYEHAAGRGERAHRARPVGAGDPRRPRRARPTTTASTGRPATGRRPTRCSPGADVVVSQDMVYPRVHPAPLETCGAVADYDAIEGALTLWSHHAGTARAPDAVRDGRRPARAQDPGDLPGHRRRLRQQGADLPGLPLRDRRLACSPAGRSSGPRTARRTSPAPRSPATTSCAARSRRPGTAGSWPSAPTCWPTTAPSTGSRRRRSTRPGSSGSSPAATTSRPPTATMTAVYTNKAPGRHRLLVLVPDHRGGVPGRAAGRLPGRTSWAWTRSSCGWRNLLRPEQFPYTTKTGWVYDSGDYEPTLREALRIADYDGAAPRAGREARPGRADGHRRLVLHRGGRRRTAQGHGHPRPRHGRRLRNCASTPPARRCCGCRARPRARATRRRSPRSSPRRSASRPPTSRSCTATPTRRRSASAPTAAAPRRCPGPPRPWSPARCATRPGSSPPAMLEVSVADLDWDEGLVPRRRRPGHVRHHPGHRAAGATAPATCPTASRVGSRPRSATTPSSLTYPQRRVHLRGRRRPGHRRRHRAPVHRRRRLRHPDQPDDRRGAGAPRPHRRRRHGADGDDRLRRARQLPRRVAHGLPAARPRSRCPTGRPASPSRPSPHHPIGAKGVGESATVGSPPAVVNAVVDALKPYGLRHVDMPLTPSRLWEAMNGNPQPPI